MESPYDILGITSTADTEEIKRSFRSLAKQVHPDMPGGSCKQFEKIRLAYEFLSDEKLRKDYDQQVKRKLAKEQEEKTRQRIYPIDVATKLEIILAWSTEKPSFNTSFTNSCLNQLAEGRELSDRQINSIENIIIRFGIDLERWLDDEEREKYLNKYFDKCMKENEMENKEADFSGFEPRS